MNFKELKIWQLGRKLVKSIYSATKNFPNEERFALAIQINRSAISIPSNIAEGYYRRGLNDIKHFLTIAIASCAELETQLILASDLGYLSAKDYENLINDVVLLGKQIRKFYSVIK